jgi:hypothetical protein
VLLIFGLLVAVGFRWSYPGAFDPAAMAQCILLGTVAIVSLIAPLRRVALRLIDSLRHPSPRGRRITAIAIGACAFAYLLASAMLHDRDLAPRLQDEFSYLIQAQLLAHGRLWLPAPPGGLADFFESFHIVVKPVYASVYFPGTSMLYVPGAWLHLPHHLIALAITGACAAMVYLLTSELLDGAHGALAAIMLVSTKIVRFNATLALSNMPAMFAALMVVWAWISWRKTEYRSWKWAGVVGGVAGWAMIVRPLDLLAYLVPISVMILAEALSHKRLLSVTVAMMCAIPFLLVQLIFNKEVTNDWFTTPYRFYFDQFQPNTRIGFQKDDSSVRVQSTLPQKIDLYEKVLRPIIREHRPDAIVPVLLSSRLPFTISATMPSDVFLIFLPLGAVAAIRNRRSVLLVTPVLFLVLYALYPFFMWYYPLVIAPAMILLILLGIDRLVSCFPRPAYARLILLVPAALCLAAMPEVRLKFGPENEGIPSMKEMNRQLQEQVAPPAVVLFSYEPVGGLRQSGTAASVHIEPVYNYDVPNPLDAPIVRAHDLGPARNREIFDYFARVRPQTMFYRMRRAQGFTLEKLGRADHLAASAHPTGARQE